MMGGTGRHVVRGGDVNIPPASRADEGKNVGDGPDEDF